MSCLVRHVCVLCVSDAQEVRLADADCGSRKTLSNFNFRLKSLMWRPDRDKLKRKCAAVVVAGCQTTGGLAENEGEALRFSPQSQI